MEDNPSLKTLQDIFLDAVYRFRDKNLLGT